VRAQALDDRAELRAIEAREAEIGEPEIHAPGDAEPRSRLGRLAGALLGRAARGRLAAREVGEHDAVAMRGEQGRETAARELDVVGVRAEEQRVRVHSSTTKCSSTWPVRRRA